MHAYLMESLGVASNQLGQVYTCVIAAAAHQPQPPAPLHTFTLINSAIANPQPPPPPPPNQLHIFTGSTKQSRPVFPVSYGPPNPVYGYFHFFHARGSGMEAVWHMEFQRLFSRYYASHSHVWFLCPNGPPHPNDLAFSPGARPDEENDEPPPLQHGASQRWQTFLDSAKVRFCCQECGHGWTSMKGRVVFWFSFIGSSNQGTLMFRLYGQKCQRCKSGHYENAMWYPEEVAKVLMNVYCNIGQVFYGLYQVAYTKSRRAGKPRTPHNSTLCQACQDGVCAERR